MLRCVGIEYRDFPTVEWTLYFRTRATGTRRSSRIFGPLTFPSIAATRRNFFCTMPSGHRRVRWTMARSKRLLAPARRNAFPRPEDGRRTATCRISTSSGAAEAPLSWSVGRASGRGVRSRRQDRSPRPRGPGTHPLQTAARRGSPHASYGAPVLDGRLPPLAKPVASVDDGPQHPQARRQAPTAAASGLHRPSIRGDGKRKRADPDHVHRPLLEEGFKLDMVNGCRVGISSAAKAGPQVGAWEVDRKRFPKDFRAISDHAHSKGMKTLLWFEPERVAAPAHGSRTIPNGFSERTAGC